jgi:hypothetical protein
MRSAVSIVSGLMLLTNLTHAEAASLAGTYQAAGKNVDGSPYSGTAEIVATSDTTCKISWQTGASTSQGICMRNGSSFAASYALGTTIGLVVYQIKPDGTLEGLWTIAGKPGIGAETLTPVKQ